MGMFDDWNPVTKESQLAKNRIKPKAKQRGEFSQKTIKEIRKRDNERCVCCGRSNMIESVPHHIIFKSHGGPGTKRNGATVCRFCHDWAHGKRPGPRGELSKEGRYWFEMWQEERLDQNGDLIPIGGS
jgi:hypothetical protein